MYRLEPDEDAAREIASLRIGRDAAVWMDGEIDRLRRLFDDGKLAAPVEGALVRADQGAWSAFECDFLRATEEPGEVSA